MLHIDKIIQDKAAQGQSNKWQIAAQDTIVRGIIEGRVKVIKDKLLPWDKESIDKLLSKWNTFILSGKLHYRKF
jgi:hypothetical protein